MKHPILPAPDVSRETREKLDVFAHLLVKWSARINLVSRRDVSQIWLRHIDDSLQLAPLIDEDSTPAIDLGTGGGFPGLILAVATNRPFHLIEADQRKAAFLREAVRATNASAVVHPVRIEDLNLPKAALVTSRALASLDDILAYSLPILRSDGRCLLLKGRTADTELTQAASRWQMQVVQWQSRTDPEARVLQLSEITLVKPAGGSQAT